MSVLLIVLSLWVINLCLALSLANELCHCSAPAPAVPAPLHPRDPGWLCNPCRSGEARGSAGLLAVMAWTGSMSLSVQLWAFSCLGIDQSDGFFHRVPCHDELLCFSAGAITTDFCAVKGTLRLTAWDLSAGAWNSPLLEAVWLNQLCLSCCGQQLGLSDALRF